MASLTIMHAQEDRSGRASLQTALSIQQAIDETERGAPLAAIGEAEHRLGNEAQALSRYRRALRLSQDVGARPDVVNALQHIDSSLQGRRGTAVRAPHGAPAPTGRSPGGRDRDVGSDQPLAGRRGGAVRVPVGAGGNLSHAFLQAGANATLVSQWRIVDWSTQQFMTAVDRTVRETDLTFAEATSEVKRAFIAGKFGTWNANPRRWAPFVYYGGESSPTEGE